MRAVHAEDVPYRKPGAETGGRFSGPRNRHDFEQIRSDSSKEGLAANVLGLKLVKVIDVDQVDWNALIDQSYLPAELRRQL